jgi:threonine/homoserine/homoserine lactone efflux protein
MPIDFFLLLVSMSIGVAIAAPLGPINIIVVHDALKRGFWSGVLTGLGSVIGDSAFASIAAYGVREVEKVIMLYAMPISVIGGLLLVIIGVKTSRAHVSKAQLEEIAQPVSRAQVYRDIGKTLALTLTNPATLMGMLAIFGSMSPVLRLSSAPYRAATAVAGVALGSLCWWIAISTLMTVLRGRITARWLDRINRWSGILIAAFGFLFLLNAVGPAFGI